MKPIRILTTLAVLLIAVQVTLGKNPCSQGTAYRGCKACGKAAASNTKGKQLNVWKNRSAKATNPQKITVQEIRDPANNETFKPGKKVWVTGYVASIVPGGLKETCNCKRDDLRDVHINIVADQSEASDQSKYVVVEFTPRWEKKFGFDDSDYEAMRQAVEDKIKDKWVKFEGWMLFDYIHANESQSTAPANPVCVTEGQTNCNWRATPWEVHPVTAYTVVPAP